MTGRCGTGRGGWTDRPLAGGWSWVIFGAVLFLVMALASTGAAEGTAGREKAMRELKPCPMSPNCVSTEAADPGHRMTPIPFAGSAEAAMARLRVIIRAIPRAEVIEEKPDYLVVNFRSRLFGFVDEAEFVVDEAQKVIRFRSGARTGYYDFGVNRSRMERVAEAFRAGR